MKIATIDYKSSTAPQELVKSLKETGFAVIRNHSLDPKLIKAVYEEWDNFFASEDKHKYLFDPQKQSGYFPFKSENAKDSKVKDLKEFYHLYAKEQTPDGVSSKTWKLRNELNDIGINLLQWIQDNVPDEVRARFLEPLPSMVENSDQTLFRILHYPPLQDKNEEGAVRGFFHSDINLITLLLTAAGPKGTYISGSKTGLEVKDLDGNWHEVESDPNSLIINCGDFLEAASGGYLISTVHQVKNPPGPAANVSRYSCPLFIHPRPEVFLTKTRTAGDFLEERLKELGLKK